MLDLTCREVVRPIANYLSCLVAVKPSWKSDEKVPIQQILEMWSPPDEDASITAITYKNKGWYEHMPADSPGTLFVGQIVFLKPPVDDAAPYVLLVTKLYPPGHTSGKSGAGYFFLEGRRCPSTLWAARL
jgi:hypothetical protein